MAHTGGHEREQAEQQDPPFVRTGEEGVPTPGGVGANIIDLGDLGSVVTGLPVFNQALRNTFSNIFTNFLGQTAGDQGLLGEDVLGAITGAGGGGAGEGAEQAPVNIPTTPGGAIDQPVIGGPGGGEEGGGLPSQTDPSNQPKDARDYKECLAFGGGDTLCRLLGHEPGVTDPDAERDRQNRQEEEEDSAGSSDGSDGGSGDGFSFAGGNPHQGETNLTSNLFDSLIAGNQNDQVGASVGLGTVATALSAAASAGSLADRLGLFGGGPQRPRQAVQTGSPFQPSFNTQNSLQEFLRNFQLFGAGGPAGGGRASQIGASPHQADALDQVNTRIESALQDRNIDQRIGDILTGNSPLFGGTGQRVGSTSSFDNFTPAPGIQNGQQQQEGQTQTGFTPPSAPADPIGAPGVQFHGFRDRADNPLTRTVGQLSLPGFGGRTFAPATPLQRQASEFASEFLASQPTQDTQRATQELLAGGDRFDLSPQFEALEERSRQRLSEESARLNEQLGQRGLRFGTDVARGQADLREQFLTKEATRRADIAQQAFENAANRRLQTLQALPQIQAGGLQPAQTAFELGASERKARENAIQRQMAEFSRTQGGIFPLMLKFALAGTEGDTVVLEPPQD